MFRGTWRKKRLFPTVKYQLITFVRGSTYLALPRRVHGRGDLKVTFELSEMGEADQKLYQVIFLSNKSISIPSFPYYGLMTSIFSTNSIFPALTFIPSHLVCYVDLLPCYQWEKYFSS